MVRDNKLNSPAQGTHYFFHKAKQHVSSDGVTLYVPLPTMVPRLSFHRKMTFEFQVLAVMMMSLLQVSAEIGHCVFCAFEQVHLP